jgi:hypothetical protein
MVHVTLLDREEFKPSGILQSKGARADIFRSIVVFLHATFEDAVRSQIPREKPNNPWNFSAKADLDKALKRAEIDASPFKNLYPPLMQLAKDVSGSCTMQICQLLRLQSQNRGNFMTVDSLLCGYWRFRPFITRFVFLSVLPRL